MRELEEWERPEETLRNGKTFDVEQALRLSEQRYRETRVMYNLVRGRAVTKIAKTTQVRRRSHKYTLEDAEFISSAELDQIQQRYNCTLTRARYLKYYVPPLYGLRLR